MVDGEEVTIREEGSAANATGKLLMLIWGVGEACHKIVLHWLRKSITNYLLEKSMNSFIRKKGPLTEEDGEVVSFS